MRTPGARFQFSISSLSRRGGALHFGLRQGRAVRSLQNPQSDVMIRASVLALAFVTLVALCGVAQAAEAEASHILVATEARCNEIKAEIDGSADKFEAVIFVLIMY